VVPLEPGVDVEEKVDDTAEVVIDETVPVGDIGAGEEVLEACPDEVVNDVDRGAPPVICGFAARYTDRTTACAPGVLDSPETLEYSIHLPLASTATATHALMLLHVCKQSFKPVADSCRLLSVVMVRGTPAKT